MEWKVHDNKAHDPKPPFLFHSYCTHFFFCLLLFFQTKWQFLPLACGLLNTVLGFSWIYVCVYQGELCVHSVIVCVWWWGVSAFLYERSLLVVAGVAHWSFWPLTERCRARLSPPSWKLPPAKQIKRYPLPTHVSWKMTGQDILPSGHSQLTAINYTAHGR